MSFIDLLVNELWCFCWRLCAACSNRSCRLAAAGPMRALRSITLCFKRIFSKFGSDAIHRRIYREIFLPIFICFFFFFHFTWKMDEQKLTKTKWETLMIWNPSRKIVFSFLFLFFCCGICVEWKLILVNLINQKQSKFQWMRQYSSA